MKTTYYTCRPNFQEENNSTATFWRTCQRIKDKEGSSHKNVHLAFSWGNAWKRFLQGDSCVNKGLLEASAPRQGRGLLGRLGWRSSTLKRRRGTSPYRPSGRRRRWCKESPDPPIWQQCTHWVAACEISPVQPNRLHGNPTCTSPLYHHPSSQYSTLLKKGRQRRQQWVG